MTSLADLTLELDRLAPVYDFPWHDQQLLALQAAPDTLVLPAGNRGGKSEVAAGIVARLVRREGPIYDRLMAPRGRPLKIWVAPQTLEKYTSNWEDRLERRVFAGIRHTSKTSPWPVWTWEDDHGGGELWGKSQDQGWRQFESDDVDLIIFDEEPEDPKLLSSAQVRTATTRGTVVLAYTPLLGLTWTWHALVEPATRPEFQVADRHWRTPDRRVEVVQWGMADNPAAVAGGGVERLVADSTMSEAERRARLYGEYGFAEGLIFPMLAGIHATRPSPYLVATLPPDRPYTWTLTIDPNKRHAGLLVAQDHKDNRFVVAEHYAEGWPDTSHARAYQALVKVTGRPPLEIPTFADPGGAGAQAILNMAENDIWASPVPKGPGSVKASIEVVRRLLWVDPSHRHPVTGVLGAPRLYFLQGLRSEWAERGVAFRESRLLWELRQYRQDPTKPPDTPLKEADDAVDCLRYHALVRPIAPDHATWAATVADEQARAAQTQLDTLSRRASQEYDEAVERLTHPPATQTWDLSQ